MHDWHSVQRHETAACKRTSSTHAKRHRASSIASSSLVNGALRLSVDGVQCCSSQLPADDCWPRIRAYAHERNSSTATDHIVWSFTSEDCEAKRSLRLRFITVSLSLIKSARAWRCGRAVITTGLTFALVHCIYDCSTVICNNDYCGSHNTGNNYDLLHVWCNPPTQYTNIYSQNWMYGGGSNSVSLQLYPPRLPISHSTTP